MNICSSNINFKAIKVAETKNVFRNISTNIDIYKLNFNDKKNLDLLCDKVDFKECLNNLSEYDRNRWKKVFEYTIESAKSKDSNAFLAISNEKPCGIISFFEDKNKIYLDSICAIPQKNSKRVNYVGSTLFYQLFKFADEAKSKCIDLLAVANGPIDVISKYVSKGFRKQGMDGEYVKMSCNKYKIKEQLHELSQNIEYKKCNKSDNVDLFNLII